MNKLTGKDVDITSLNRSLPIGQFELTTGNMKAYADYFFPVPVWSLGGAKDSPQKECLRQVKSDTFIEERTIRKGTVVPGGKAIE